MSVTGRGTKLVFCEGGSESLDIRLLNRLLLGHPNALVVPVGGKWGIRAFMDGHLSTFPANSQPEFVAFRDRDFDAVPGTTPKLIELPGVKPIFLSHRACVENYLLDAELIHEYWDRNRETPKWSHGASPGADQILEWMETAAKEIADYQAVRWALSRLKPGKRWPEVPTTWTDGSGDLPRSLQRDDCLPQARRLIESFERVTKGVSEKLFDQQVEQYLNQFGLPSFWEHRDYRIWFHGKDLQKAMQRSRPDRISLKHFFSWAVDQVAWGEHPDLLELAEKI
jgi:hypothetical protein